MTNVAPGGDEELPPEQVLLPIERDWVEKAKKKGMADPQKVQKAQADYLDAMHEYGNKVARLFETHLKGRDLSRPIWIPCMRGRSTACWNGSRDPSRTKRTKG